jgi:hypothetical protein
LNGSDAGRDYVIPLPAGTSTSLMVQVTDQTGSHMISGILVVARPGSTIDAGDPAGLPSSSAALPANQLSTSDLPTGAANSRSASLGYIPPAKGTYPIVFLGTYATTADCSSTAPMPTDADHLMRLAVQVGTLEVQ